MDRNGHELRAWLHGVRRAWRRSAAWLAVARTAAALALLGWAGWAIWRVLDLTGGPLVLLTAAVLAAGAFVAVRLLSPLRRPPTDQQIARLVEERVPDLDDLLVTASQRLEAPTRGPLDGLMLGAAASRVSAIERGRIVDPVILRRRTLAAIAALAVLATALVMWRVPGWRAFQTTRMFVAPPVLTLHVTPGDARTQVGKPLPVTARLDGLLEGVAPSAATLHVTVNGKERALPMTQSGASYRVDLPVERDFKYRVVTDRIASREFAVTALHPAQVQRIDVQYEYPKFTGLKPRLDENSGDIFGPAGTKVKVRITSDKPVTGGALAMRGTTPMPLAAATGASQLEASFTLEKDAAYRVTLNDVDGLTNVDATEYFIRLLNDRPPDVRVMRPGGDRQVTRLEEIVIEARADDDYGISSLDLVYAVRGGAERVIPLGRRPPSSETQAGGDRKGPSPTPAGEAGAAATAGSAQPGAAQAGAAQAATTKPNAASAAAKSGEAPTNVGGAHTLYVEELDVQPGDFITYYARARDIPRGKRSSESRSDIFFLEVRPFAEEFVAAQSQAGMMGGGGGAGDLLEAQKEIIVATWKVQRRSEAGKSEQDIRAIAKAQAELKGRAEQMAAMSAMTMPRRGRRGQPQPGQPAPAAAGENPILAAAEAMGKAAQQLDGLKPDAAIPHEMTAYNQLLKAQADNRRTQVARQRGGGGGGGRSGTQDLSALFDRELMRQQETNYETRSTVEQREQNQEESALDKIRELARRQDEIARQQRDLTRQRGSMEQEEVKRRLERLTKEQEQLRREAEQLAQQMGPNGQNGRQQQNGQQSSQGQQGQQSQGQQSQGQQASSQSGSQGSSGQPGQQQSGQQQNGQQAQNGQQGGQQGQPQNGEQNAENNGDALQQAAREMADAARDMARADMNQAQARTDRSLERLRDLERRMRGAEPDERRRAVGELQVEAQQMAEAQQRLSQESRRLQQQGSPASGDALRRMATEQDRLADRARSLRRGLQELSQGAGQEGASLGAAQDEIARQKLDERMRQGASSLRTAGDQQGGVSGSQMGSLANQQDGLARAMAQVAQKMGSSVSGNAEARRLSDQLAQIRDQKNRLDEIGGRLQDLANQAQQQGAQAGQTGQNGRNGKPGQQPGQQAGQQGNQANGQQAGAGQQQGQQNAQSGQSGQQGGQQAGQQGGQQGGSQQGSNGSQGSQGGQQGQSGGQGGGGQGGGGGQRGGDANGADGEIGRLQAEYDRQLRQTRELMDSVQREQAGQNGPGQSGQNGSLGGGTPMAHEFSRSAPGTEAFKQDYAKWDVLRKDVANALEQVEMSLSQRLSEREAKDRLNAGGDDRAPAEYAESVSRYYRSLAKRQQKP